PFGLEVDAATRSAAGVGDRVVVVGERQHAGAAAGLGDEVAPFGFTRVDRRQRLGCACGGSEPPKQSNYERDSSDCANNVRTPSHPPPPWGSCSSPAGPDRPASGTVSARL